MGRTAGTDARDDPRRATSVAHLTHVGLELFYEQGFDETTVDQIAAAAGIGRRTFFRYFASKNDLPWGNFDGLVARMRDQLAGVPHEVPMLAALHQAVLDFNRYPAEELPHHRQRMKLLLTAPSLIAHSALRYAAWREAIAEFAALRLRQDPGELQPQVIGWTFLAVTMAAYEEWLRDDDADLLTVLDQALDHLEATFGTTPR